MNEQIHISVVTPVYGCTASLGKLYERLKTTLEKITGNFEIIMVNDSSPDNAWEVITTLAEKDSRIKGINLSRNFGQHRAITAGLDYAQGDWVVVMDCDLQDQPEEIIKLYDKAQDGFDIIFGKRKYRKDSVLKRLSSRTFYFFYNYFTDNSANGEIGNFSIISQNVVQELRKFSEENRPYALLINWVGFKRCEIDIQHDARAMGHSSYTFIKLVHLATDIIISHSNKPLKLSIIVGFFLSVFSLLYAIWLILRYYFYDSAVEGWTSTMVSIFFMGGLIIFNLGVIGLYVGKIYNETKRRPYYIIKDKTFQSKE